VETYHPTDFNKDGIIDTAELSDYIEQWKSGSVEMGELMTAINIWKNS